MEGIITGGELPARKNPTGLAGKLFKCLTLGRSLAQYCTYSSLGPFFYAS